jgi:tyrosine-protein phosphatase SIW14
MASVIRRFLYRQAASLAILGGLCFLSASTVCVRVPLEGVPRAARVNAQIYRGGQPTDFGFQTLAKKGIKTVLDLREHFKGGAKERREVESLGMRYVRIPMRDDRMPSSAQVQEALAVLEDTPHGPVFVHCDGGRDRTGMVIACYRIRHDHWTNARALREAHACASRKLKPAMQRWIRQFRPAQPAAAGSASAGRPAAGEGPQ